MLSNLVNKDLLTLAIDTSCDETSVSVVRGTNVLSNVIPTQIEFHKKYGGVVPSIARLAHQERIDSAVTEALQKARIRTSDVDLIAVTKGPGLAIALEVGIKKAKELATEYNKPLMAVNHMEGHLLSSFARQKGRLKDQKTKKLKKEEQLQFQTSESQGISALFPAIGVLVSGKHTELVLVNGIGEYEVIGESMDDACGEAFDKCGRILGFGYPAGPVVAEFAKQHRKNVEIELVNQSQGMMMKARKREKGKGKREETATKTNKTINPSTLNPQPSTPYSLPVPMTRSGDFNFSYSGIKTAFRALCAKLSGGKLTPEEEMHGESFDLSKEQIMDLCVLFEETAFKQIEIKLERAIEKYKPKEIWLGGGVSANARLRQILRNLCKKSQIEFRFPNSKKFTSDNAAMIGVTANLKVDNLFARKTKKEKLESKIENRKDYALQTTHYKLFDLRPITQNPLPNTPHLKVLNLTPNDLQDLNIFLPGEFDKIDREPSLSL